MDDYSNAVRQRLLDDVPLNAIVAGNIDWGKRPDIDGITAVTLRAIADPRDMHFKGPQELRETTIQIDVWSGVSIEDARAAANRIVQILQSPAIVGTVRLDPAFFDGPEDSGSQEETLYVHRSRLIARLWHALA